MFGWAQGTEVRNLALSLGERAKTVFLSPRERGRRQTWDRCVQREMWDTLRLARG
jgi:HD-like signal output (HDOD) protein